MLASWPFWSSLWHLTLIIHLSTVLDDTSLAITRLGGLVVRHLAIAGKVLSRVHVVAIDAPIDVHLLHTGRKHVHAIVSRGPIGSVGNKGGSGTVVAAVRVQCSRTGARGAWSSGHGRSSLGAWPERSGTWLQGGLDGLESARLVPTGSGAIVIGELPAVTTVGHGTSRDPPHAGVVIVEVLLGMVVSIPTVGRAASRPVINGGHIIGGEGALERGRRCHHVVPLADDAVAWSLRRVLRDVLKIEGLAKGRGAMAKSADVGVNARRGAVDSG